MTLSYEEGMAALRGMFPSWDPTVLSELLEANQGHLENTIDMALTMEPPAPSGTTDHSTNPPPPPLLAPMRQEQHRSPHALPRGRSAMSRSRVQLPDDFLRLPTDDNELYRPLSEQEQRDAILAQMLQDEIFRQQLFMDEEFSAHFHSDRPSETRRRASTTTEKSATEIATETFNAMSEKFASMSEVMKRKMHEAYLRFQTRSDAPAEKDPKNQRPLMADDSSDEEDYDENHDVRRRNKDSSPKRNSFYRSSINSSGSANRRSNSYASKKYD